MSVSLRTVAAQDSEFAYQVKKTTLAEYVWQLWGWDEAEQRRLHQRRFASQNFQVIVADVGILVVSKEPDCLRVNQLLVLPEYQGRGGNALLYTEMEKTVRQRNFKHAALYQVAETAVNMRHDLETVGGIKYKNHRVYTRKV